MANPLRSISPRLPGFFVLDERLALAELKGKHDLGPMARGQSLASSAIRGGSMAMPPWGNEDRPRVEYNPVLAIPARP